MWCETASGFWIKHSIYMNEHKPTYSAKSGLEYTKQPSSSLIHRSAAHNAYIADYHPVRWSRDASIYMGRGLEKYINGSEGRNGREKPQPMFIGRLCAQINRCLCLSFTNNQQHSVHTVRLALGTSWQTHSLTQTTMLLFHSANRFLHIRVTSFYKATHKELRIWTLTAKLSDYLR